MEKLLNRPRYFYSALGLLVLSLLLIPLVRRYNRLLPPVPQPEPIAQTPTVEPQPERHAPGKRPWTYDEAAELLSYQPDNTYLKYVVFMLERQRQQAEEAKRPEAAKNQPPEPGPISHPAFIEKRPSVDLFSLFSGRLAVQESLQLDTLLGNGDPFAEASDANTADKDGPTVLTPTETHRTATETIVTADGKKVTRERTIVELRPVSTSLSPVPMASLEGPTVQSHPWAKMLGSKSPAVSELARCVPADFYLAEFRTTTKAADLLEQMRTLTTYLAVQSGRDATTERVPRWLLDQLALDFNPARKPFYESAIARVGVTGSDLFFDEGTDITLMFQLKWPELFRSFADGQLANLARQRSDVRSSQGTILGVPYTALTTPDRSMSVYAAYPRPDLYVRGNSLPALRRVLAATLGKDASGKAVANLGDTAEYRYVRTLMPTGAAEEDGFLYLSDPFVRRQVGPQLRITAARRRIAANHLRMIGYAAQLYRTQTGQAPDSLETLTKAGYTPSPFNQGKLTSPLGDTYALNTDTTAGVGSIVGSPSFLTPCLELEVPTATAAEAKAYGRFVAEYNQYWRTYFDPIAVRLQVTPKHVRAETLILPLMDNSIYTTLAQALGGPTEPLDATPVPRRNLFSMNLRLNKEAWLKKHDQTKFMNQYGATLTALAALPLAPLPVPSCLPVAFLGAERNLDGNVSSELFMQDFTIEGLPKGELRAFIERGIGSQIGLHLYDTPLAFDVNYLESFGQLLSLRNQNPNGTPAELALGEMLPMIPYAFIASTAFAPAYLTIPVKDAKIVDDFLNKAGPVVGQMIRMHQTGWGDFNLKMQSYRLQPTGDAPVRCLSINYGPLSARFYLARIGKVLVVTNQASVLDDLRNAPASADDPGPTAHAMVRLRPANWQQALPGYQITWAENNRAACQKNLVMLTAAARAFAGTTPVSKQATTPEETQRGVLREAARMYGQECTCPDGGDYVLASDGRSFRCTVHGTVELPTQRATPSEASNVARLTRDLSRVTASLTFLPEGLRAVFELERK